MSLKRPSHNDGSSTRPNKSIKVRTETSAADYSNDVRKKIVSSNRTGQACDRCRVRKMRCDDSPEGCSPCLQNQSPCKTTDRITGRATVRGYVQNVERRLHQLESHCRDLEERLASCGVDITAPGQHGDYSSISSNQPKEHHERVSHSQWQGEILQSTNGNGYPSTDFDAPRRLSQVETSVSRLPDFRNGLTGDNYLGVSSGNTMVSSIRGTSLNVLGMEIDLTDYIHNDLDGPDPSDHEKKPIYNKSYYAFILTAFGAKPKPQDIGLPPREEGMKCVEWFFRVVNVYLPVLHRPSFITLINRMYDDPTFEPTQAEKVTVHCVFAIMLWQFAVRNWENPAQQDDFNRRSNLHYHYALGFFRQLMASHALQDVQAMSMLCIHLRALPKPGACWMMTSTTLNLAIELGLHRSIQSWAPASRKISVLEVELRKRIFWSVLVIHIIISGKLGRPMALREEDFDVELPREISDNQLSENGIDMSKGGKCDFLVGLASFRFEPICIDLYNNIYAVRRSPRTYIETVVRLERRIQGFIDSWDGDQMREWDTSTDNSKVYAMYLRMWPLEFRLLLRHPSLSLTSSSEFNNESLTICMDISKRILGIVKELQAWKSLDSNWQTGAVFVLAISTTLFGHWERKDELNLAGFEILKEDMRSWLSIMGDMGRFLGSGKRLEQAVRVPIENTLSLLSRHLAFKTASSALATTDQDPSSKVIPEHIHSPQLINERFQNPSPGPHSTPYAHHPQNSDRRTSYMADSDPTAVHLHPQQTVSEYAFAEPPSHVSPDYLSNPASISYAVPDHQDHSIQQHQYPAAAGTAFLYQGNRHHSQQQLPQFQAHHPQNQRLAPADTGIQAQWRHWAGSMAINRSMASNLEPQEFLNSASALMQLGAHDNLESAQIASSSGTDGLPMHVAGLNRTTPGLSWPNGFFGPDVIGDT